MARRRGWIPLALGVAVLASTTLGLTVALDPDAAAGTRTGIEAVVAGAKPVAATVTVSPAPGTAIGPSTPITVQTADGVLRDVHVTNTATGRAVDGRMGPDGRSWGSTGDLAYAASYTVSVDSTGQDGTPGHQDSTVRTVTPAAQAYPSLIPAPSSAGSVGVGQPIVVRFDHAVHDRAEAERHLHVTSSPAQPGSWYWISDSEAHYRPQVYWKPNSTLTVNTDLYGVDLGKGVYGATDRTETVHVHDAWVAKADGASEQMQIFDDGRLVRTMKISLGSPGFPSHTGPHVISDKQPTITMDSCTYGVCQGQPGYYNEKVDLDERISNDGEFVHSAPWSVGQQGNENVSHGCVNLAPADAQWFFDHFGVGDVVEITNSGGPTLPIYDIYGDWELDWAQWQKGSAL